MSKANAIALMGPTASGKTDLAIALYQQLDAEIISVDSALVYKGLDIVSAKPSQAELALAPHHLINVRNPEDPYCAADFRRDAKALIEDIVGRGKTPILVGGTMMYFKALLDGLSPLPESQPEIRSKIEHDALNLGWPEMHVRLARVDAETAAKLHPNHSQRIARALEVFAITGQPLSALNGDLQGGLLSEYHWLQIAIAPKDRKILHERIALRFQRMLEQGGIEEVQKLKENPLLHKDLPSMRAVGYRQIWEYLDGEYDYDTMLEKGVAATRQLAKRQITWLRSWHSLNWLYTQDEQGNTLSCEQLLTNSLAFMEHNRL